MTISALPPSIFLIIGAFLVPFLKGNLKKLFVLALPLVTLVSFLNMETGTYWQVQFLDMTLVLGRVDKLSFVFGLIFIIFDHWVKYINLIYAII